MRKLIEKLRWIIKDTDKVISINDEIIFESFVHGSVGIWYELDYDKEAFAEDRTYKYVDPSFLEKRTCGGDKEEVIVSLTALKKGVFRINEIENFRGNRRKIKTHKIRVK